MTETESSVFVFGRRKDQPVVLKVVKRTEDEWLSGAVLHAFEGRGVVRVFDYVEGALLLERLSPGSSLVSMATHGRDDQATGIVADVIGRMSPQDAIAGVPTVEDWGLGFGHCQARDDNLIPRGLVEDARLVYSKLCVSQSRRRLLHGDLHHDNVLLDSERGWLAVDPKGVVGELEYEVGAALRNPHKQPELFASQARITRRVDRFERELHLDAGRVLAWAFSQAVLAAIWAIEDGFVIEPVNKWIALANTIRPMIRGVLNA